MEDIITLELNTISSFLNYKCGFNDIKITIKIDENNISTNISIDMNVVNKQSVSENKFNFLFNCFVKSFESFPLFVTEWVLGGRYMFWYETRRRLKESIWKRNWTPYDPKPQVTLSNNKLPTINEDYFYSDDDESDEWQDLNMSLRTLTPNKHLDFNFQTGTKSVLSPSPSASKGMSFKSRKKVLF